MDTYGKYIRLFGTIFFTFIGFLVVLVLFLLGMKLLFNVLTFMPWTVYVYMLFMIAFPSTVFVPVYIIYFRRTKRFPVVAVRYISYLVFAAALICWGYALVKDMIRFFKFYSPSIDKYNSYELWFLAANVAAIFAVGIIQALSTPKEGDWMDKYRNVNE